MNHSQPSVRPGQWTKSELAAHIEAEYLSGSLPSGSPLPSERAMCEMFGVSRPFVREVLSGLQQRGRIDIRAGHGAFVRALGITEVGKVMRDSEAFRTATPRALVEARLTLEMQTTALAARRATPEDIDAIERALEAFDAAEYLIERASADIAFHFLIARASANPVLETMFGSIAGFIFELMLKSLGDPNTSRQGVPYHADILQAIKDGDVTAAVAAVEGHIGLAERTFGDDYDKSLELIAKQEVRRAMGHDAPVDQIISSALKEFGTDAITKRQP